MKQGYCYFMTNKKNWTLYTGITSDLEKRVREHKNWVYKWFTSKYTCIHLVRYEEFATIAEAIDYEKKIKWWTRIRKVDLIEKNNKKREDLASNRFKL